MSLSSELIYVATTYIELFWTEKIFKGVDLSESELRSAWMGVANFSGTRLCRANLSARNASGANFSFVDLEDAMMRSSMFEQTNFASAKLCGAKVGGTCFERAYFRCEGLEKANLLGALSDDKNLWPESFNFKKRPKYAADGNGKR